VLRVESLPVSLAVCKDIAGRDWLFRSGYLQKERHNGGVACDDDGGLCRMFSPSTP